MTKAQNWGTTVSKLIAKAWIDNSFYHRFIEEPAAILREAGIILDDFTQVKVNQNSTDLPAFTAADGGTLTINLPAKPTGIADELLNWLPTNSAPPLGCTCLLPEFSKA